MLAALTAVLLTASPGQGPSLGLPPLLLRQAAPLPPEPPLPDAVVPQRPPPRTDELTGAQLAVYLERSKSGGIAVALEFLFPGAGTIYAHGLWQTGVTYLGLAAGAGYIFAASRIESSARTHGALMAAGLTVITGVRIFGILAAPFAASSYNAELKEELGLTLVPVADANFRGAVLALRM